MQLQWWNQLPSVFRSKNGTYPFMDQSHAFDSFEEIPGFCSIVKLHTKSSQKTILALHELKEFL